MGAAGSCPASAALRLMAAPVRAAGNSLGCCLMVLQHLHSPLWNVKLLLAALGLTAAPNKIALLQSLFGLGLLQAVALGLL